MKSKHLLLVFILFSFLKGKKNDLSMNTYDQMNSVLMTNSNQSFIIKTTEPSIAYFDAFGRSSNAYISKDINEFNTETDKRITGQFVKIEPNEIYYVRICLLSDVKFSNVKFYVSKENLSEEKISIKEKEWKFIYLQKDKKYTLDFKENTISKRMIKLSQKTKNSKIIINDGTELTEKNLYYQLEDDFKGELNLEVKDNDAFIEFLQSEEDFDKFTNVSMINYEIKKKTNVIIIEKTQKHFFIKLYSDKEFNFSFSYGLSNNQEYFYENSIYALSPLEKEGFYNYTFKLNVPYKNISLIEKEFFSFTVKVDISDGQKLFLDYWQESLISPILDEKMEKSDCENIIKYLVQMYDLYIFTDIAKNPPTIKNIDNYHHRKIDIKKELSSIKIDNRYFYEFYQEVMTIITTVKDYHLKIYASKTPKGIPFNQYQVSLPFNFIIKKDKNKEFKLFIELNDEYKTYDEETQKNLKVALIVL